MTELATSSAVILAVVFAAAAVSKARHRASTEAAFREMGIGVSWSVPAVIIAEFVSAVALVISPRTGSVLAVVMLAVFTGVLLRAIRLSGTVRCGCFGSASMEPVGPHTILRNFLLGILAVCSFAAPWPRLSFPASLTVGALFAGGSVVVALVRMRNEVGRIFPSVEVRG
jgi:Methylamine utilisation protein MauE